jgi:hypothetical protein
MSHRSEKKWSYLLLLYIYTNVITLIYILMLGSTRSLKAKLDKTFGWFGFSENDKSFLSSNNFRYVLHDDIWEVIWLKCTMFVVYARIWWMCVVSCVLLVDQITFF